MVDITRQDIKELSQNIEMVKFKQNEAIFEYGTQGDKFYIILEGKVSVSIPNPLITHWQEKMKHYKELLVWKRKVFDIELEKCKQSYLGKLKDDPEKYKQVEAKINLNYYS